MDNEQLQASDLDAESGSDAEESLKRRRTSLAISAIERRGSRCAGGRNSLRPSDALLIARRNKSPSEASEYRTDENTSNTHLEGVESVMSDVDSPVGPPAVTPRTLHTNSLLFEYANDSLASDSKSPITLLRITKQAPPDTVGFTVTGTTITSVSPQGPAAQAGLRSGIRIISVNGERVLNEKSLKRAIAAAPENFTVSVDTSFKEQCNSEGDQLTVGPVRSFQRKGSLVSRTWGSMSPTGSSRATTPVSRKRHDELVARLVLTAFYATVSPSDSHKIPSLIYHISKGKYKLKDLLAVMFTRYTSTKSDWTHGVDCYGVSLFIIKKFVEIHKLENESPKKLLKTIATDMTCGWLEARHNAIQHLIKRHGTVHAKRWTDDVPLGLNYLLHPHTTEAACASVIAIIVHSTEVGICDNHSIQTPPMPSIENDYSIAINHVKLEDLGTTVESRYQTESEYNNEVLTLPTEGTIFRRRVSSSEAGDATPIPGNDSVQPDAVNQNSQPQNNQCSAKMKVFRRTKSSVSVRKNSAEGDFNDPVVHYESTCDEAVVKPRRRRSNCFVQSEVKQPASNPLNPLEVSCRNSSYGNKHAPPNVKIQTTDVEESDGNSAEHSLTGMGIGVFGTPLYQTNDNKDFNMAHAIICSDSELLQRRASRMENSTRNLREERPSLSDQPIKRRASKLERQDHSSRCLNESNEAETTTASNKNIGIPPLSPSRNTNSTFTRRSSFRKRPETPLGEAETEDVKRSTSVTFVEAEEQQTKRSHQSPGRSFGSNASSFFGGPNRTLLVDSDSQAECTDSSTGSRGSYESESNIPELKMTIMSLTSQVSILTDQLDKEETKYQSVSKKLKERTHQLTLKEKMVQELQETVLKLQEKLCENDPAELELKIDTLTKQLKDSQQEFSTFISNQAAVMGELYSDTSSDKECGEERRRSVLATSTQQNVNLTNELSILKNRLHEQERTYHQELESIRSKLTISNQQVEQLQRRLQLASNDTESANDVNALNVRILEQRISIKKVQKELKNEKFKNEKLQKSLDAYLNPPKEQQPADAIDIDYLEVELLTIKSEVKRLRIKLNNRQQDYATATSESESTNRCRIELAQQLMDLESLTTEIKRSRKKVSGLESIQKNSKGNTDLIDLELCEERLEISNLENAKVAKSKRVDDLRSLISSSSKEGSTVGNAADLKSEIRALKKEINTMIHRKQSIESRLSACRSSPPPPPPPAAPSSGQTEEIDILKKALIKQASLKTEADKHLSDAKTELEATRRLLLECKTEVTLTTSVLDRLGLVSAGKCLSTIPEELLAAAKSRTREIHVVGVRKVTRPSNCARAN